MVQVRWRIPAVLMLALVLSSCSSGDTNMQTESPSTTAGAQLGATSASPTTSTSTGRRGFVDALGESDRVCVDVDQIVAVEDPVMSGPRADIEVFDIRSGEILAGNFATIIGQWSSFGEGGGTKIYWIPLDPRIAITEPLELVVEPLDSEGPPRRLVPEEDFGVAWGWGGAFWASTTPFPNPGRYRLTASAPGHWGCFELTV